MDLVSLTYTSVAAPDLSGSDVDAIHQSALTYNPLDGITGILLFNGGHFLQMVEGAESAIDDLLARLSKDRRHHSIEVRDRRSIERRFFPNWSMHRIDIPASEEAGMERARIEFANRLDDGMMQVVGQSIAAISKPPAD